MSTQARSHPAEYHDAADRAVAVPGNVASLSCEAALVPAPPRSREAVLAQLMQGSNRLWRGRDLAAVTEPGCATGFAALDAQLPGAGWPAGALTELLIACHGVGEMQLLLPALVRLARAGKHLLWVAPPQRPYAPALQQAGLDPAALVVVQTTRRQDLLWTTEQALRSATCAAVLLWPGAVTDPRPLQYADLRRLQLAAEGSRTLVFLFRPLAEALVSSCAALRLQLNGREDGRLEVQILKRRGAMSTTPLVLDLGREPLRKESIHHDLAGHPLAAPPGRINRRGEFIT